MGEFKIIYTEEQKKAFEHYVLQSMQEWTQHAFDNKCRQRIEQAILDNTDKNPNKLSNLEKVELISNIELPKREK